MLVPVNVYGGMSSGQLLAANGDVILEYRAVVEGAWRNPEWLDGCFDERRCLRYCCVAPHKLLAWRRRGQDGQPDKLIVAGRDEATCNNLLLIYVRAFLGKLRALQLSRMSTFMGSTQQRRNQASVAARGFVIVRHFPSLPSSFRSHTST